MITNSGYAVKWTPLGKGVPGWLCDHAGDIIYFPWQKVEDARVLDQSVRNLPGYVWGVFLHKDNYPEDNPQPLLMYPEEAAFNYA